MARFTRGFTGRGTGARDARLPEGHEDVAVGDLAAHSVERLVLDEDDRVFVADRALQQALGVGSRRGRRDEQAGDVQVDRLEAV